MLHSVEAVTVRDEETSLLILLVGNCIAQILPLIICKLQRIVRLYFLVAM
jgi:hypothetical protein